MRPAALTDAERRDWLRLSLSENVGPVTFNSLLRKFGTAGEAIAALPDLSRQGGLSRPLRLCGIEQAEQTLERARRTGARFVALCEPGYPAMLRETEGAPPLLCIKGDLELLNRVTVGIVGARNASAIARKFARQLAAEIGAEGHVIASGLARGIDTAAHEASVSTGTVAVVAGGVDVVYPPENEALQRDIGERGVIVSEMPPGAIPKAEHFPRRNRIISGLSRAVVIVEAAIRSGSLITARYASEQGREVFAVPGSPLDPRCEGCNRLIRDGATLLLSAQDVIETLNGGRERPHGQLFEPDSEAVLPGDADGKARDRVLELLSPSPIDVDDLIRESGLAAPAVTAALLELELAGRALRHPRGAVSLA